MGLFSWLSTRKSEGVVPPQTKMSDGAIVIDVAGVRNNGVLDTDTMLKIEVGVEFTWSGRPYLRGTGGTTLASRTCRGAVTLENNADRCKFDGFTVERFNDFGVYFGNKTTVTNFGIITALDIGSGYSPSNYSLTSNYSAIVNSGTHSSLSQLSVISVSTLPPDGKSTDIQAVINGKHYYIASKDIVNNTISVFPWVDSTVAVNGTLYYKWGGGAVFSGGDASNLSGFQVDGRRCSTALYMAALYSPVILGVTAQFCGTAIQIGYKQDGSVIGGEISGIYTENNDFDLVVASRVKDGIFLSSNEAFNFNKIDYVCSPRTSSNTLMPLYANLQSIIFNDSGVSHTYQKMGRNGNELNTTEAIDIFSEPKFKRVFRKNSAAQTINLTAPNDPLNQAFGYDSGELILFGTGVNNEPTNTVTFNAPVGFKVNNGASAVFSGFSRAARFAIYYRYTDLDFKVVCYDVKESSAITKTYAYDPPSLSVGQVVSVTTALLGAVVGDRVDATFSLPLAGCRMWAEITSAGNVTIYLKNETSGGVDLASGNIFIRLG